jgi:heat shock protein HslJ
VNHLTASYSVTAEYLTFGPLATSRRAGAPDRMELEHRVLGSLAGMCPFYLSAHTLWIDGPAGRIELIRRSAAPDPSVTG